MKKLTHIMFCAGLFISIGLSNSAYAAKPLWTYTPLSETRITVSPDGKAQVKYRITNNSKRLITYL